MNYVQNKMLSHKCPLSIVTVAILPAVFTAIFEIVICFLENAGKYLDISQLKRCLISFEKLLRHKRQDAIGLQYGRDYFGSHRRAELL